MNHTMDKLLCNVFRVFRMTPALTWRAPHIYIYIYIYRFKPYSVRRTLYADRNLTIIYYSMYIYTCPLIVMLLLYSIIYIFIDVR